MIWLGQPLIPQLVCICLPTCSHLSLDLFRHGLAGLDAVTRWSGSVSSLSPRLFQDGLAPALCLPTCLHLSPLFPHALAGLDAVTRWSGSVSSLSPHSFPCFSPHVSSLACWAGCCHEMVSLCQLFVPPLVCICLPTRWSGSVSSLSPTWFSHSLAGLDAVTRWSG